MANKTIESKVADAILQRAQSIEIGGKQFDVTPPTTATLIMVSEAIAELPKMNDGSNIVIDVLGKAKEAKAIGKIVAILILGAKRIKENRKIRVNWFKKQSELQWMSDYILDNLTTSQIASIMTARLNDMEIGDFFGITASLRGTNIIKPTKEAEIASGEQS